jgi:hypothetical protein
MSLSKVMMAAAQTEKNAAERLAWCGAVGAGRRVAVAVMDVMLPDFAAGGAEGWGGMRFRSLLSSEFMPAAFGVLALANQSIQGCKPFSERLRSPNITHNIGNDIG